MKCTGCTYLLYLSLFWAFFAGTSLAITIRDDAPEDDYADLAAQFPAVGYFGIVNSGSSFCTGVLVAPDKVLSSAHCFDDDTNGVMDRPINSITFGVELEIPATSSSNVASVQVKPLWETSRGAPGDDLAVVTLSTELPHVAPATLSGANPTNRLGTFLGYGDQGTGANPSAVLGEVDQKLAAQNMIFSLVDGIVSTDFDHPLGVTDTDGNGTPLPLEGSTATGDSGGPLYADFDGSLHVVGILNTGGNLFGPGSAYGDISEWTFLGTPSNMQFLADQNLPLVPEPAAGLLILLGAIPPLLRRRRGALG